MWRFVREAARKAYNNALSDFRTVARWFSDSRKFHDAAQGAFAIVGMFTIIVGAVLYFAERRTMPRVVLEPNATVVGLTPKRGHEGRLEAVLLQVSVAIENRSSWALIFNCAAIDLIGLRGGEHREPTYMDDLAGISLLPMRAGSPNWDKCVYEFENTRRKKEKKLYDSRRKSREWVNPPEPNPEATSGARYRDFFMEPGERTTKTWEQRIPCAYDAVRVIFKLPKPYSTHDYETKVLVPIADVCANKRNVSNLGHAPVAPTQGDESANAPEIVS